MKKLRLISITSMAVLFISAVFTAITSFIPPQNKILTIEQGTSIAMVGGNMGSRMLNYGNFETEIQLRFANKNVKVRNMCDGGDTPGFRPHSGKMNAWAFPGAEKFQTGDLGKDTHSQGTFGQPDEWLTTHKTDIVIGFFGFSESFEGKEGLTLFKAELEAFIKHTQAQKYNGKSAPQIALVSPTAFENRSVDFDVPNGLKENSNILLYRNAMRSVALKYGVIFVDPYQVTVPFLTSKQDLTIDGVQLNAKGDEKLSTFLVNKLFGSKTGVDVSKREAVKKAVLEKDWFWHNDFKIPNGVHVFGQRHKPFGPDNYPFELTKVRQMTANRDQHIWAIAQGKNFDLTAADAQTEQLPEVQTNYKNPENVKYLYGDDALKSFTVADGFKIDLFASEKEFPDLANPSQIAFDNKGRLWVACMPSYPHWKPGDGRPNDKLIILEDTNADGKADKLTTFVDNLHIPAGFEFAPEGVYVSQGTNLKLFTDTNGDDKADKEEIIMSGFDDHDTHHVISAFCADESGAIYMGEGIFLHSNVETAYGTIRATHGGFMRYAPQRKQLERVSQVPIPNPWGIGFDRWGQNFFLSTSGPDVHWMMPGTNKSVYGYSSPVSKSFIEEAQRVRPTSGLEFVSSRHFPENMQGDMMFNNTIGFLGTKVHQMIDDGTGYKSKFRTDLVKCSDPNYRPVDLEFAPDGSLYIADWHNALVGHMQHNARDPLRDHVHGRIYRITYPSRPLVTPKPVAGASVDQLLENLKEPEYRLRYRSRRELRGRNKGEVIRKTNAWVASLDKNDVAHEHHLLEALWVSWGLNQVNQPLLNQLLASKDERIRAAAVRVLRYTGHQVSNQVELLKKAVADTHGRVRFEAFVAGTWQKKADADAITAIFEKSTIDQHMKPHYDFVKKPRGGEINSNIRNNLSKGELVMAKGKEIYNREGYCATCHQPDGKGLEASAFPPLAGSEWVSGSRERLIKLVMHGIMGPIEVKGKKYPGDVPMTPYAGMLNDEEMSAVLNYVRNSFGNTSDQPVTSEMVKEIRATTKKQKGFYSPAELLKQHPQ